MPLSSQIRRVWGCQASILKVGTPRPLFYKYIDLVQWLTKVVDTPINCSHKLRNWNFEVKFGHVAVHKGIYPHM